MAAACRGIEKHRKDEAANVKRGSDRFRSRRPHIGNSLSRSECSCDGPSEIGTNRRVMDGSAAPSEDAVLSLSPFRINQNLALGAVESSAEAAEADKFAKERWDEILKTKWTKPGSRTSQ